MTFLLDVNVLIASVDRAHVRHDHAHVWIVGNPKYPGSPRSPAAAAASVRSLLRLPGRIFWPDDLSFFDTSHIDIHRITTWREVTETYLLALAKAHGAQFATFDRRLSADAIEGGDRHLVQIAKT